ncbi:MAG: histidine kinase N-terminal 7TM domain-containing protein [Candidatus Margulisiibacteriota bacterium]
MTHPFLSAIITALTSCLLGIVVFLKNRKDKTNKAFVYMSLAITLWSFSYSQEAIATNKMVAYLWDRLLYIGAIFIPSTFFHFALSLIKLDEKKMGHIRFVYSISFIFLLLNITPWFTSDVVPKGDFKFSTLPGPIYPYFMIFFLSAIVYALLLIAFMYKDLPASQKKRVEYVFVGAILTTLGGSMNYLFLYSGLNVAAYGNYFVAAYTILFAYAITKHHLMDISVFISKGAAYVITVLVYLIGYVAGALLLMMLKTGQLLQIVFASGAIIFAGPTFLPVSRHLQTVTENTFFRNWNEFRKLLKSISVGLNTSFTRKDIVKTVESTFNEKVDVSSTQVLFFDEKAGRYVGWEGME